MRHSTQISASNGWNSTRSEFAINVNVISGASFISGTHLIPAVQANKITSNWKSFEDDSVQQTLDIYARQIYLKFNIL